jgi:hypothetical protein
MTANKHNLLLHRVFQYLGIILIMAAIGGGYWYWKQAQAGLNLQSSQEGTLSNGLVGYWPFDGNDISGTTAYDRSGQGNNGTLTNGPTKAMGKVGQALSFDGSDDYIDVPDSAALSLTGDMTISAWVNPSNLANIHGIIGKTYSNVPGPYDYYIDTDTGGGCGGTGPNKRAFYRGNGGIYAYVCSKSAIVANKWQHVAVTMSGTTVTHYLDGVPDGAGTLSTTIADSNTALRIGSRNDDYTKMFGALDEPRIYNRALSAGEIWDLYQMGNPDKMNSADSQGDSLEKGMVGYWKLDDASGTSATDSSGNANTGTLTGSPTWISGKVGGGLSLNGTSQYVSVNDETKLNPSVVSVSAWAYRLTDVSTWPVIVHKEVYSTSKGYVLGPLGNGEPVGFRINGDNVYVPKESSSSYNQWVHYVGIFDGNKMYLYKNGVLQETVDPAFTSISSSTQNLGIGLDLSGSSTYWNGSVDEVRIYNRALSADEVAKLYKTTAPDDPDTGLVGYWSFDGSDISGTTAYDRSGKGNTGTLANSPTKTIGKSGQALSFDGTNDQVITTTNYGDSSSLRIITLSAWFKTSVASGKKIVGLEQVQDGYNNNKDRQIYVGTDGKVYFALWDGNVRSAVSSGTYTDGNWHHAVGVSSGNNTDIKLYIDGVLQQTTAIGTIQTYAGGTSYWRIGSYSNDGFVNSANGYFPGSIDEVRVYNRVLLASEIWGLYQAGAADKVNAADSQGDSLEKGIVGYWKLDDASGTSAVDASGNANTGTLTNGPTWTTGHIAGATNFDGTDDYTQVPSSVNYDSTTSTWCFWYNSTGNNGYGNNSYLSTILGRHNGGGSGSGINFYISNTGDINFQVKDSSNNSVFNISTNLPLNVWHHICGVTAPFGEAAKLYTDGSLKNYATAASVWAFNGQAVRVADSTDIWWGQYAGKIDEVRVYNRALSADEVAKLYKTTAPDNPDTGLVGYWSFNGSDLSGTTAYDRSRIGKNATLVNGASATIGKVGQGINLDGSNDYLSVVDDVSQHFGTGDFTYSFWTYLNDTSQGVFFSNGTYVDGIMFYRYDSGTTYLWIGNANGQSSVWNPPARTWQHVVLRRASGTVYMYANGVQQFTLGLGGNVTDVSASGMRIGYGFAGSANTVLNGRIDEFRMYNRAISTTEIADLYNAGR